MKTNTTEAAAMKSPDSNEADSNEAEHTKSDTTIKANKLPTEATSTAALNISTSDTNDTPVFISETNATTTANAMKKDGSKESSTLQRIRRVRGRRLLLSIPTKDTFANMTITNSTPLAEKSILPKNGLVTPGGEKDSGETNTKPQKSNTTDATKTAFDSVNHLVYNESMAEKPTKSDDKSKQSIVQKTHDDATAGDDDEASTAALNISTSDTNDTPVFISETNATTTANATKKDGSKESSRLQQIRRVRGRRLLLSIPTKDTFANTTITNSTPLAEKSIFPPGGEKDSGETNTKPQKSNTTDATKTAFDSVNQIVYNESMVEKSTKGNDYDNETITENDNLGVNGTTNEKGFIADKDSKETQSDDESKQSIVQKTHDDATAGDDDEATLQKNTNDEENVEEKMTKEKAGNGTKDDDETTPKLDTEEEEYVEEEEMTEDESLIKKANNGTKGSDEITPKKSIDDEEYVEDETTKDSSLIKNTSNGTKVDDKSTPNEQDEESAIEDQSGITKGDDEIKPSKSKEDEEYLKTTEDEEYVEKKTTTKNEKESQDGYGTSVSSEGNEYIKGEGNEDLQRDDKYKQSSFDTVGVDIKKNEISLDEEAKGNATKLEIELAKKLVFLEQDNTQLREKISSLKMKLREESISLENDTSLAANDTAALQLEREAMAAESGTTEDYVEEEWESLNVAIEEQKTHEHFISQASDFLISEISFESSRSSDSSRFEVGEQLPFISEDLVKRGRRWFITVNNYVLDGMPQLTKKFVFGTQKWSIKRMSSQYEFEGTHHLHIFVQFNNPVRINALEKHIQELFGQQPDIQPVDRTDRDLSLAFEHCIKSSTRACDASICYSFISL